MKDSLLGLTTHLGTVFLALSNSMAALPSYAPMARKLRFFSRFSAPKERGCRGKVMGPGFDSGGSDIPNHPHDYPEGLGSIDEHEISTRSRHYLLGVL